MKEKNKKIGITVGIFSAVLLLGVSQPSFAEEVVASSTAVIFTVSVGDLSCTNGEGKSNVSFDSKPFEGGYYEVSGDMITKNNITLNRKVDLPSGKYIWKGFANNGYTISGDSSGEFTVKNCATKTETVQVLKGVDQSSILKKVESSTDKKVEVLKTDEKEIIKSETSEIATSSSSTATLGSKVSKEIFGGLVLLVAVLAFFGLRNRESVSEK